MRAAAENSASHADNNGRRDWLTNTDRRFESGRDEKTWRNEVKDALGSKQQDFKFCPELTWKPEELLKNRSDKMDGGSYVDTVAS